MLDKLLKGGLVVDGTGSEAFHSDVGIKNGCIEAIGDLSMQPHMKSTTFQEDWSYRDLSIFIPILTLPCS